MYLLDANIILEGLLVRERAEGARRLLENVLPDKLCLREYIR